MDRFSLLRGLNPETKIRANNLSRLLSVSIWRSGELCAWLAEHCNYLAEPRHVGDALGDAGCYRAGSVLAALELARRAGSLPACLLEVNSPSLTPSG